MKHVRVCEQGCVISHNPHATQTVKIKPEEQGVPSRLQIQRFEETPPSHILTEFVQDKCAV